LTWPKRKSCPVRGPGSKVDVVRSSGSSRPDIVLLSLRRVDWHFQHIPALFVGLLRREERLLCKNILNIILTHSLLPLGQSFDQVEPMQIPDHGRHCFRTADRLAFNCWGTCMVRKPDLFVLIREIKIGLVQRNNIFPTLVLDGRQQIHVELRCTDSGRFLSLRQPVKDPSAIF
jgi:hypothetical protein